jgi:hypothetical protein
MNACTFSKRSRTVILAMTTSLFLAGVVVKAQTAETAVPPFSSEVASTSVTVDTLPDAPSALIETPQQTDPSIAKQKAETRINPISLLSPRLISGTPLTAHDKFEIYIHKTYSPAAVIYPLFGVGIKMARPNKGYPKEWQDGMGAFGRNYGSAVAQRTAKTTAEFGTQVIFHEDPRYERSNSTNPMVRVSHAVGWTLFDKSDSGHRMLAVSTFTSAAAGSFVGMAYLPAGYNDASHAEQRMAGAIGGRAISNILTEFEPMWGPLARKIRIHKLLPEWWVTDRK